jgi:hypothetical protein
MDHATCAKKKAQSVAQPDNTQDSGKEEELADGEAPEASGRGAKKFMTHLEELNVEQGKAGLLWAPPARRNA